MEGNATDIFKEEFQEINDPAKELLQFSVTKNGIIDPPMAETSDPCAFEKLQEEETLKARLEELKKENFSLQASINAWQITLNSKLDEFKEADLKLNKIYNEIWAERENFCSKTDEFNNEFGILSEWWERQMKFVSDLEHLERERLKDQKCQQEIKELEMKVNQLKKEMQAGKEKVEVEVEVEVHASEGDFRRNDEPAREVSSERLHTKKAKFLPMEAQIEVCGAEAQTTKDELFALVDLEKVRRANRIKHRRCKAYFHTRMNKIMSE